MLLFFFLFISSSQKVEKKVKETGSVFRAISSGPNDSWKKIAVHKIVGVFTKNDYMSVFLPT